MASLAAPLAFGPSTKIIGIIEGLTGRLREEAAAEADHKAWRDEQLEANKMRRNEKTAKRRSSVPR